MPTFNKIAEKSKLLDKACQFYLHFNNEALPEESESLPLLRYLIKHGDSILDVFEARKEQVALSPELMTREDLKYDSFVRFSEITGSEDQEQLLEISWQQINEVEEQ